MGVKTDRIGAGRLYAAATLPTRGALTFLLLSMCSCGESLSKVNTDVSRLESDMKLVRNFQAEQTAALDELRSQVRTLEGRLEEMHYSSRVERERANEDLARRTEDLARRIPPPAIVPMSALEADEALASEAGTETARFLTDALANMRQGNFNDALAHAKNGLQESQNDALAPNLQFWVGVAYDGMSRYRESLAAYHDLVKNYPNHRRAPLALLREANSLVRLGDMNNAKLTLKRLTLEFPKTEEAQAAADRLRSM